MNAGGDERAVVVAMESGAAWPRWLGQQLEHSPNLFCAVQQRDDEPTRLPRQVDKLGKELESSPYSVQLGVMLFGSAELDVDARVATALALGSTLSAGGLAELVLVGPRRRRACESLLRVAQLVAAALRNPSITVRTLFLPTAHARGLQRAVPRQRERAAG